MVFSSKITRRSAKGSKKGNDGGEILSAAKDRAGIATSGRLVEAAGVEPVISTENAQVTDTENA